MDVAYVEMIEDLASGWTSTAQIRAEVDAVLNDVPKGMPMRPVDRDAWLRGDDARAGQAAMFDLVRGRR